MVLYLARCCTSNYTHTILLLFQIHQATSRIDGNFSSVFPIVTTTEQPRVELYFVVFYFLSEDSVKNALVISLFWGKLRYTPD